MQGNPNSQPTESLTPEEVKDYFLAASTELEKIVVALEDPKYAGQLSPEQLPDLHEMFASLENKFDEVLERNQTFKSRVEADVVDEYEVDVSAILQHLSSLKARASERITFFGSQISKLEKKTRRRQTLKARRTQGQPPLNAQFLLYLFLEKRGREEAVGDALEEYSRYVKRVGKLRADILFYQEVGRCAWPFIKRMVAKVGGLIVIGEWLRKLTH